MSRATTPISKPARPVKQEIRLATRDSAEPLVILAEIHCDAAGIPALALHRCQYGWGITHIRSGYRVERIVGPKSLALQAMAILLDPANADWDVGEFSSDPEPIFAATDVARRKVFALLYPGSAPLPPYRTPRERRAAQQARAQESWAKYASRPASRYEPYPAFVAWATPEIDYSGLREIGLRSRYAVVRHDPTSISSGLTWVRYTLREDGSVLGAEGEKRERVLLRRSRRRDVRGRELLGGADSGRVCQLRRAAPSGARARAVPSAGPLSSCPCREVREVRLDLRFTFSIDMLSLAR